VLRRAWATATREELLAALPGRTWQAIGYQVFWLGLGCRKNGTPELRAEAKVAARRLAVHHGSYAKAARELGLSTATLFSFRYGRGGVKACRAVIAAATALPSRSAPTAEKALRAEQTQTWMAL